MSIEPLRPFDLDNTDDLSEAEIGTLNDEFTRTWLDWRIRAPTDVPVGEIVRNLVQFVMRRYFGE